MDPLHLERKENYAVTEDFMKDVKNGCLLQFE